MEHNKVTNFQKSAVDTNDTSHADSRRLFHARSRHQRLTVTVYFFTPPAASTLCIVTGFCPVRAKNADATQLT